MNILIFKAGWILLLVAAASAQALTGGKARKKAGVENNIFVIAAFVVALGWFFVRDRMGTYSGSVIGETAGAVLMATGVAGYMWALAVLGRNWSISAEIKEGHALITAGPYRFVRHPMYMFMMLAVAGSGLLISNYMILICSPAVGAAYYFRAKTEERLLREEFAEYEEYAKKTKMLIPGIL